MNARGICLLLAVASGAGLARGQLVVVRDGRPEAVLVVPENALPVSRYAAEEFAEHVRKASGATLPVVSEDALPDAPAGRIFIGPTKAAQAAGIDLSALGPEDCRLLLQDQALYIAAADAEGNPLDRETRAGSLWGVYELLERLLQARWLWPGDLGTVLVQTQTIAIPPLDETLQPSMLQRNVRDGLRRTPGPFPGFSDQGWQTYVQAQRVFWRRHRMGRSKPLRYGHAFPTWWEKHGETHPEWFQLLPDGTRGPARGRGHTSMCVSNTALHQEIINRWRDARAQNPAGPQNVNGTENDIAGLCTCPECEAWDGPQVDEGTDIYAGLRYRRVSDRYARFWLALYELAVKEDPNAMVMGYAYINYYPKPSESIRLNPNILIGMCPWPGMWYPRTDREQTWLKEQWQGWARTGASIFYRPNTTLDGYAMPHNYMHQFADEFQFYARNRMVATDFDSLTGQWATQGPTLYTLFRLHVRPHEPIDEVLAEYYSAFGPAAKPIKAYFDYWETHTTRIRDRLEETLALSRASRYRQYARAVYAAYPPECFLPAEAMLAEAAAAAAADAEAAARVDFIRKGFEHARLCRELSAAMNGDDGQASPMAALRIVERLRAFREATEGDFIANFARCAGVEERSFSLPSSWNGEPLAALSAQVEQLAENIMPPPIRGTAVCVALLGAGDTFRAHLQSHRIGRNESAATWLLFAPDDSLLAQGEIPPGESADIAVPAAAAGVHLLAVNSHGNVIITTLLNNHAALAGRRIALAARPTHLYLHVPPGQDSFGIVLQSPAPGETAHLRILSPDGTEVANCSTGETRRAEQRVAVPPGQDGKAWSVIVEKAASGILEDYTLELDPALPAYWSLAPDRLLLPAPGAP